MIRNILFDLGNVLIDVNIHRTLAKIRPLMLSLPPVEEKAVGNENRNTIITAGDLMGAGESGLVAKYQVGEISTDDFVDEMLSVCKPGTTRQEVIDAWMAMLVGIPEARKQRLLELHQQGYKLYVLSNINELHAEWTREQIKDIPFEQMFFSNEIHLSKPDSRCYELVIRETGIKPEETLYIDDLPANIEAGREAGFQCFLNTKADEWAGCDLQNNALEMAKNCKITH